MSLLEDLGLDPATLVWQDLSLCQGMHPRRVDDETVIDVFFEGYETDPETAKQVDEMCLSCPVIKQCAMSAMTNKEWGARAGSYWGGNGRPDPARMEHQDEEYKERLREALR